MFAARLGCHPTRIPAANNRCATPRRRRYVAGIGSLVAGEDAQQAGLAAAVPAQQSNFLTRRN